MDLTVVLVLALGAALVIVVAVLAYRREQARHAALQAWAVAGGWQLVDGNDRWVEVFGGTPFGVGSARRAEDVCTRSRDGQTEVAFTYRYATYRTVPGVNGAPPRREREEHSYRVVAIALPVPIGPVQVVVAGFGERVVTALGGQDVEIEHAEFNRRHRVTAADAKLATDLLSPRVVEQLLAYSDVRLRLHDGWALAWDQGQLSGPSVDARLAMLRAVVDGVPRFVWLDHGHDPG